MPVFQEQSLNRFNPGVMFLELLVIVFGISASFWVDEWREEKQDTEIFNRILGEVYYSFALDDNALVLAARQNNAALFYASNLVIKQKPLPEAAKLFEQIEEIFVLEPFNVTTGSYERLVNTSLAIPVNQTQLTLDRVFGAMSQIEQENHQLYTRLQRLAEEHWQSRGVIPCRDTGAYIHPSLSSLDIEGMLAPTLLSLQNEEGDCLTDPHNHEIALRAMASDSFKVILRRAINIRQELAVNMRFGRSQIEGARQKLIDEHPQLTMPIQSIQLVGSATAGKNDPKKGLKLQRVGPVEWQGKVTLEEGYVFFSANESFTITWMQRWPWMPKGVSESFDAANSESWFPSNTAIFKGWATKAEPGTYEVYFNSQTYEYRFEIIE